MSAFQEALGSDRVAITILQNCNRIAVELHWRRGEREDNIEHESLRQAEKKRRKTAIAIESR